MGTVNLSLNLAGGSNLPGLPGIESHGRSLLVWPLLVTEEAIVFLRFVIPLGVRIIFFGEAESLDVWPGRLEVEPLTLWERHGVDTHTSHQFSGVPDCQVEELQCLYQDCGITPLPSGVFRRDAAWRHALRIMEQRIVAAASVQMLHSTQTGEPGEIGLVCAVSVRKAYRQKGLGRSIIQEVCEMHPQQSFIALTEHSNPEAHCFFQQLGWLKSTRKVQFIQWK